MQPSHTQTKIRQVAVIGAGPAGLVGIKSMLEAGLDVTAFETRDDVGGTWNYDEALPEGGSLSYRALTTNTSRRMTCFSDFPFDESLPDYPQRADVLAYLQAYASHFDLRRHIRFGTSVDNLTPTPDGRWTLDIRTADGMTERLEFDAVLIASGYFTQPYSPDFPGLRDFRGRTQHSAAYTNAESYTGLRVVVVGGSSSGTDIAVDIAERAASVDLSARSGVWFTPHYSGGRPGNERINVLTSKIPLRLVSNTFSTLILKAYAEFGFTSEEIERDLKLPDFTWPSVRLTPGSHMLAAIKAGKVKIQPNISRIEADRVVYEGGCESMADAIVFATGFQTRIRFLSETILQAEGLSYLPLYRYTFLPDYDNLAVLGFCRVSGPVLPVMEMQARWAAQIFIGNRQLPSAAERREKITAHMQSRRASGISPMQVQYAAYMEAIAAKIGVQPQLWKRPGMAKTLIAGPLLPARYRLDGPGKWAHAKRVIRAQAQPASKSPLPDSGGSGAI